MKEDLKLTNTLPTTLHRPRRTRLHALARTREREPREARRALHLVDRACDTEVRDATRAARRRARRAQLRAVVCDEARRSRVRRRRRPGVGDLAHPTRVCLHALHLCASSRALEPDAPSTAHDTVRACWPRAGRAQRRARGTRGAVAEGTVWTECAAGRRR